MHAHTICHAQTQKRTKTNACAMRGDVEMIHAHQLAYVVAVEATAAALTIIAIEDFAL